MRSIKILATLLFSLIALAAQASTVKIFDDGHLTGAVNINTFYNNNGHTSSMDAGAISGSSLAGVDLLVAWEQLSYSASDISAMSTFLGGGGRIAFFGENDTFDAENNAINSALTGLGSSMQIGTVGDDFFDTGFNVASGAQITGHSLNAGVSLFEYAAPNDITIGGGASLFLSLDLSTIWASFDNLLGDGIVVMTDSNVTNFSSQFDNSQWFLNLLDDSNAIPEPSIIALLGLGLFGLGFARRRKVQK